MTINFWITTFYFQKLHASIVYELERESLEALASEMEVHES